MWIPEELPRQNIDAVLKKCGWKLQTRATSKSMWRADRDLRHDFKALQRTLPSFFFFLLLSSSFFFFLLLSSSFFFFLHLSSSFFLFTFLAMELVNQAISESRHGMAATTRQLNRFRLRSAEMAQPSGRQGSARAWVIRLVLWWQRRRAGEQERPLPRRHGGG
jgi:hypothetical protein